MTADSPVGLGDAEASARHPNMLRSKDARRRVRTEAAPDSGIVLPRVRLTNRVVFALARSPSVVSSSPHKAPFFTSS